MISVKVSFRGEVRRFSLNKDSQAFQTLLAATSDSFGVKSFQLSYVDDEADRCVVGGNEYVFELIYVNTLIFYLMTIIAFFLLANLLKLHVSSVLVLLN